MRHGFNRVGFNRSWDVATYLRVTVQSESSASTSISIDMGLTSTVECTSTVTVLLTHDLFLGEVQIVVTESTVEAALAVDKIIQGLIGGAASLTVALDSNTGLISSIDGVSVVDGQPYSLYIYATYTTPDDYIRITWEGT